MTERNKMNECYFCIHKKDVPGDCHIGCDKPDQDMTGHVHGIRNGWFMYPFCFDPIWKTKDCSNYQGETK